MYKLASLLLLLKVSSNPVYINYNGAYYPTEGPSFDYTTTVPEYNVPYERYNREQDYRPIQGYPLPSPYGQVWGNQPSPRIPYGGYPTHPQTEAPFYYFPTLGRDPMNSGLNTATQTDGQGPSTIRDSSSQSEGSLTASSTVSEQSNLQTNETIQEPVAISETPVAEIPVTNNLDVEPSTEEEPAKIEELHASSVSSDGSLESSTVSTDDDDSSSDFSTTDTTSPADNNSFNVDDDSSVVEQPETKEVVNNSEVDTSVKDNEKPVHAFAYGKKHSLDRTDIAEFDAQESTVGNLESTPSTEDLTTTESPTIDFSNQETSLEETPDSSHNARSRHNHGKLSAATESQTQTVSVAGIHTTTIPHRNSAAAGEEIDSDRRRRRRRHRQKRHNN